MINDRIAKLKSAMAERGVDILLIPTADYHQSEYVGDYFKARAHFTGFTGSAGCALFSREGDYLWTDGRYFLQAEAQLIGSGIQLMRMGEKEVPTLEEWLGDHLKKDMTLAVDGRVIPLEEGKRLRKLARQAKAHFLWDADIPDLAWEGRPPMPKGEVWILPEALAGENSRDKLDRVRQVMKEHKADLQLVSALDDICWTLNLRGSDIAYFPLMISYLVIGRKRALLFVDEDKLPEGVKTYLELLGVHIRPYEQIYPYILGLKKHTRVMLDPRRSSYALYKSLPKGVRTVILDNPQQRMKAIKNPGEIKNIRKAQQKDGVAHVRLLRWLKEHVGQQTITELDAQEKLEEFREAMGNYLGPSFDSISAYGPHGAIIHYSATKESNARLLPESFLLMDCGAGYLEGSTDITRTYGLGEVSPEAREDYTLVLKCHLRLLYTRFKKGCTGGHLDMLARGPLWERGLDFNHGTGHGVGYLLNIHEGPQRLAWKALEASNELEPGMVITNEPGLYRAGAWGIRLENEVLVTADEVTADGEFYRLVPITFVPFDRAVILPELLNKEEKERLRRYNKEVFDTLKDELTPEEQDWLKEYLKEI